MVPLSISTLRAALPIGHENGELESTHVADAAGRFYADLSLVLRHPIARRMILRNLGNMDQLAVGALTEIAVRPDFSGRRRSVEPPPPFCVVHRDFSQGSYPCWGGANQKEQPTKYRR